MEYQVTKSTSPRARIQTALTKKDMVNYIGPIFEEMKSDSRRLEVMMEANQREVLSALETYFSISEKEEAVKDHETRVTHLERDVKILKTVSKI